MNQRRSGLREDWPKWPSGYALLRLPNTCASRGQTGDGELQRMKETRQFSKQRTIPELHFVHVGNRIRTAKWCRRKRCQLVTIHDDDLLRNIGPCCDLGDRRPLNMQVHQPCREVQDTCRRDAIDVEQAQRRRKCRQGSKGQRYQTKGRSARGRRQGRPRHVGDPDRVGVPWTGWQGQVWNVLDQNASLSTGGNKWRKRAEDRHVPEQHVRDRRRADHGREQGQVLQLQAP